MADYIPFEIQTRVIKKFPIKALIRFRSVSKPWKSLIDSSRFIVDYHVHREPHVLLKYFDWNSSKDKYFSILDDDTFPQQKFPLTIPKYAKRVNHPEIVGSSQGLFCFFMDHGESKVVLWNPSIRKSVDVDIDMPDMLYDCLYETIIGFGVCCGASDPKLVKIRYLRNPHDIDYMSGNIPSQVEVFTLSSCVWRSPLCSNLPSKNIEFTNNPVVIDGFIYWHVYEWFFVDYTLQRNNQIMSFDMTSEAFTQIYLPHSLEPAGGNHGSSISKLRESLVMIKYDFVAFTSNHGVWMMENGVPNSFTKLFTIRINIPGDERIEDVIAFSKSGKPIIAMMNGYDEDEIIVYEPSSEHVSYMGISGLRLSCFASSYMETLLLLDH